MYFLRLVEVIRFGAVKPANAAIFEMASYMQIAPLAAKELDDINALMQKYFS